MALIGETKFIERLQFFNGQRLAADDLQNLEQFNREMRWLHNQSLHQPGVGSGYAVSGLKGDREITIQPGYAIDSLGREIVLTEAQVEQIPPVADDGFGNPVLYDLTVSYPDDQQLEETETRDGVCVKLGVVRRREEPVFCWVRLGPEPGLVPTDSTLRQQIEDDLRIRLGRITVLNCQLYEPISVAERRNARPPEQPYVACGRTDSTGWKMRETKGVSLELRFKVNTDSADFRTTPCYYAHVVGNRLFDFGGVTVALDGFGAISEAAEDSFIFSFLIPLLLLHGTKANGKDMLDQITKQNAWIIEWLGVER